MSRVPFVLRCVMTLIAILICGPVSAFAEAGDVPVVTNSAEAANGRRTVEMEELWRIGGEDDDLIFGLATQVVTDENGRIYILDSQLCEVRAFTQDGELVQTLFRAGEGPGEVARPRDLCLLGDGSVGVSQEMPGRIIRVDRNNTPLPVVDINRAETGGLDFMNTCFAGGPSLVIGCVRTGQRDNGVQARTAHLSLCTLDGETQTSLISRDYQRDFNNFVFSEKNEMPGFWYTTAVDDAGRVYTAPYRDRYRIEIYSPQGVLEKVIERDYESLPRRPEDMERFRAALDALFAPFPIEYGLAIEDHEYTIMALQRGLRVRDDGSLWILPGRGVIDQPEGVMMTFDVFDPEGRFDRQVSLRGPHDGVWDGLFFVGPDRAIVITGYVESVFAQYGDGGNSSTYEGESEGMQIICYALR